MSKDITTKAGGALAKAGESRVELMRRLYAKGLAKMSTYKRFPSITAQHGVKTPKFELGDNLELEDFRAVILNGDVHRDLYFDGKTMPECSSVGGKAGTVFGVCSKCKYYEWGTGQNGVGRACTESRRLLLKVLDQEGVFEIKLSPTSLAKYNEYEKSILNEKGIPFQMVVTKFSLEVMTKKGRKPWSVTCLTQDGDTIELPEAVQDEVFTLMEKYENAYMETKAPENVTPGPDVQTGGDPDGGGDDGEIAEGDGDVVPF